MKLVDVEAVARALNAANVPFIVVGGVAVVTHGYGRYTDDLDLVIRLEKPSIEAAFKALASIGYFPRVPVTAAGFSDAAQRRQWIEEKGMTVLNFHSDQHRETPVDLFIDEPFDFVTEYDNALVQVIPPDTSVPVVRLSTLYRMKEGVGRPQDLADVDELRRLHGGRQ